MYEKTVMRRFIVFIILMSLFILLFSGFSKQHINDVDNSREFAVSLLTKTLIKLFGL